MKACFVAARQPLFPQSRHEASAAGASRERTHPTSGNSPTGTLVKSAVGRGPKVRRRSPTAARSCRPSRPPCPLSESHHCKPNPVGRCRASPRHSHCQRECPFPQTAARKLPDSCRPNFGRPQHSRAVAVNIGSWSDACGRFGCFPARVCMFQVPRGALAASLRCGVIAAAKCGGDWG